MEESCIFPPTERDIQRPAMPTRSNTQNNTPSLQQMEQSVKSDTPSKSSKVLCKLPSGDNIPLSTRAELSSQCTPTSSPDSEAQHIHILWVLEQRPCPKIPQMALNTTPCSTAEVRGRKVGMALSLGMLSYPHCFIYSTKVFPWHFSLRVKFSTGKVQQSLTSMVQTLCNVIGCKHRPCANLLQQVISYKM